MENLAALIPTRDPGSISLSIIDLRKEFTLLYKAFGDFEPIINKLKEQTKQIQRSKPSTTTTTLAGKRRKKVFR
jgi:hypothetical protein